MERQTGARRIEDDLPDALAGSLSRIDERLSSLGELAAALERELDLVSGGERGAQAVGRSRGRPATADASREQALHGEPTEHRGRTPDKAAGRKPGGFFLRGAVNA